MERRQLIRIYKKLEKQLRRAEELYLIQSIEEQALFVCRATDIVERYDSSTSRFGNGSRENSFRTPPGLHRIKEKIGAGAPVGRIFRDREDTGTDWDGASTEDNLITSRILWLEGLEEGINRGPGIDTYDRYVYIHGTGREDLVGSPLSHGCLCLRNNDVIRLFETVPEGTLVYIEPPALLVGNIRCRTVHFAGIFGTGMSALAQYLRFQGIDVSGSDRLLDSEDTARIRLALEGLGCVILPQDGSGINEETDVLCVSTAIEDSNPEIAAARTRSVPIVHRSDLLAALIASKRTIAVAGTSGKSTVTAMIFEFLTACEKSPSLISGAPLCSLERAGMIGNAYVGASDLLVVEADESDGTIAKYAPDSAVVINVSKDHKGIDELIRLFETLIARSRWATTNADDPILASLPASERFGLCDKASWRPDREELFPMSVKLFRREIEYCLPLPGRHNLENLRAALCLCEHLGCEAAKVSAAVKNFEGVARRFSLTDTCDGVRIVDDYAHNPAKIEAVVDAARGLSPSILAVYQPHGFGPTRFLKDEYVATFRRIFRESDYLYLLPIYYAGGTADMTISSEDIIKDLGSVPFRASAVGSRDDLLEQLKGAARPGDCVLIMGARDPSLPALVAKIARLFGGKK